MKTVMLGSQAIHKCDDCPVQRYRPGKSSYCGATSTFCPPEGTPDWCPLRAVSDEAATEAENQQTRQEQEYCAKLRDTFAGLVLAQLLVTNATVSEEQLAKLPKGMLVGDYIARKSYLMADFMLKWRNRDCSDG